MNIWIDLWAAPDPLFFRPIVKRLHELGHTTWITAREFGETIAIAKNVGFQFEVVGRHGGRTVAGKLQAILKGAMQLAKLAGKKQKIDLAVSYNSYAQSLAAKYLGIPSITCMDYEYQPANHIAFRLAKKVIVPEGFDLKALQQQGASLSKTIFHSGLKEHVTLIDFVPDPEFPNVLSKIGVEGNKILITMRPPATWATYHQFENKFFEEIVIFLATKPEVNILLLPRSEMQSRQFQEMQLSNLVIPPHILDGPNLVYYSDIVISGGGSMNREAVVLGTPAYTVFKGKMAGVDQKMIADGILGHLDSADDLKDILVARKPKTQYHSNGGKTLDQILNGILNG